MTIKEQTGTTEPLVENKLRLVYPYSQELSKQEVKLTGENIAMQVYSFHPFSMPENLC